ncbi:MAG: hypothetical protein KDA61_05090 [Planctomycetales bacterium]|nr:hypothetical protein [Planctomycetales bacterium]
MSGRFQGFVLRAARATVGFAFAALLVGSAYGQFVKDDPTVNERDARLLRSKATRAITSSSLGAEEKSVIDQYFTGFYFPAMSRNTDAALGSLARLREDLFRLYINRAVSPDVRNYLIGETIKDMGRKALGNYHPAVRYNAILVVANLDAEPAGRGSDSKPVPLEKATEILLRLVELDSANNVPIPSSLKIGALVGLERHTRYGIDPKFNDKLVEVANKVLGQTETPPDISRKVHAWMKCQAAALLVNRASAAADAAAHNAVMKLIADEDLKLDDRCQAARLLAKMHYAADPGGLSAGLDKLGLLALQVATAEHDEAAEVDRELLEGAEDFGGGRGGMGFSMGRGGFGELGAEEETGPRYEKRRFLRYVNSVVDAVNAVNPALSPEDQQRAQTLLEAMKPAVNVVSDRKALDVDVLAAVMQMRDAVKNAVAAWNPDAAAPAEENVEDAFGQ